jgi:hypothetical protein
MRVNREDEFRDGLDRYLRSIKMKILAFQEKNDLKDFLERKMKVELIFLLSPIV